MAAPAGTPPPAASMSLATLCDVLAATVSPVAETRKAAEATLTQHKFVSGHLSGLMQCMVASQLDGALRLAAAIQFKALVVNCWAPDEDEPAAPRLPEADKAVVRANMLEAVVQAPPNLRQQLGVALRAQLDDDFPDAWPELLPSVVAALGSAQGGRLHGGLFVLRCICRKYEYKDPAERGVLHAVVRDAFPHLLLVFQGLLQVPGCGEPAVAELLKLCLKSLWSCVYLDVAPTLQQPQVFHAWMAGVGALVERALPAEAQPQGAEERAGWGWWKAKKWAFRVANRLFTRYSKPSTCRDAGHKAFAARFRAHYAVSLVAAYARVLGGVARGDYLSDRCTAYALQLLEAAVPKPGPYRQLEPLLAPLLRDVAFPLLCFTPADAALWRDDPAEYVRKGYDIIEDMYSPRTAALSFVTQLLRVRPDQLHPFLAHVGGVLQRCAPAAAAAAAAAAAGGGGEAAAGGRPEAALDGALYALGGLVDVLKRRPPYSAQLEPMLLTHVLPEFGARAGHLRAKACWVAGQYADISFSSPASFNALLSAVVAALCDPELPVRVDAVIALRSFVDAAPDVAPLRAVLPQLLDQLFRLMAEVDHEDLVFTLEAVVEKFGDEMVPYAVGLIQNLVGGFWRTLAAAEAAEGDGDGGDGVLECMGTLRAMATVLDAVSDVPSLFPQLEPLLLPVLQRTLRADGQDVYEEALQVLNYVTYFAPVPVSNGVWALFPVLVANLAEWGADYFADSLPALDNLISREPARFLASRDPVTGVTHLDSVLALCASVLGDPDLEDEDCVPAPQLLAVVLQHCPGRVDGALEPCLRLVASRLEGARPAADPFLRDVLLLVWAHALVYDAPAALGAAQRAGALAPLFRAWTAALAARRRRSGARVHFRREQDKKAVALALGHLLSVPPGAAPPEVEAAGGAVLTAALSLLSDLKLQRDARLAAEAAEAAGEGDDEEEEEGEDGDGGGGGDPTAELREEEEEERQAQAQAAAQAQAQPAQGWGEAAPGRRGGAGVRAGAAGTEGDDDGGGGDDGDSDWSDYTAEEDGASSPLDSVDPWVFFADALQRLPPARQQHLTRGLDFPQQAALHALGGFAQQRRAEIAAAEAGQQMRAAQALQLQQQQQQRHHMLQLHHQQAQLQQAPQPAAQGGKAPAG